MNLLFLSPNASWIILVIAAFASGILFFNVQYFDNPAKARAVRIVAIIIAIAVVAFGLYFMFVGIPNK